MIEKKGFLWLVKFILEGNKVIFLMLGILPVQILQNALLIDIALPAELLDRA